MSAFDANDLRLRVQSSFSLSELRRLLGGWGAMPEEAEGDAATLAHRVVKIGYKRFGPAELIHKLRAEKPLTEWPDPGADADERWAPRSLPEPPPYDGGETTVVDAEVPQASSAPTTNTLAGIGVVAIPEAQPSPPSAVEPPSSRAPESIGVPPSTPLPSSHGPRSAPRSNPMVFLEAEALRNKPPPDPRRFLVLAVGAGVLFLALFAVGLIVYLRNDAQVSNANAVPTPTTVPRSEGPAGRAANILDGSLKRVADTCGLDVVGDPSNDVFFLAQEACGRDEALRVARAKRKEQERALRGPDATDDEPDPLAIAPPPPPTQDRLPLKYQQPEPDPPANTPPPAKVKAGAGGCTGKCQRTRSECDRSCGPEPKDASNYGGYQSCIGRCVATESRCRTQCI